MFLDIVSLDVPLFSGMTFSFDTAVLIETTGIAQPFFSSTSTMRSRNRMGTRTEPGASLWMPRLATGQAVSRVQRVHLVLLDSSRVDRRPNGRASRVPAPDASSSACGPRYLEPTISATIASRVLTAANTAFAQAWPR